MFWNNLFNHKFSGAQTQGLVRMALRYAISMNDKSTLAKLHQDNKEYLENARKSMLSQRAKKSLISVDCSSTATALKNTSLVKRMTCVFLYVKHSA